MNVPFLVSNILSGVGMCAMLASTALRSRRKILAVTFAGGFQWYGLLPVLATALYSAVIVHPRCNARWIKASTAVCTMMWAVYSLFIRNYVYVLTNVITSASAVLFLLRSRKQGETTV